MSEKILVLIPLNERHKNALKEKGKGAAIVFTSHGEVKTDDVEDATVIIGNVPLNLLEYCKCLKWIHLESAGTEGYRDTLSEEILLTNSSGAYGTAISEHMLGCLLMLYKNLHIYRDNQRLQKWEPEGTVKSIASSRVLIVGTGDLGGEFAKRIKLLGGYTMGIKKDIQKKVSYIDELHSMDRLNELLPHADVVALCLPGTKETKNIINSENIELMKNKSILINVGRGISVDTNSLYKALTSGSLGGAAIDVTDPEPLPQGHPLWEVRNIIITPHISGGYFMEETLEKIVSIASQNLELFLQKKPLKNIVSRKEGY